MRQIEPKMIEYLDQKLSSNGLAQQAIETKDARTLFVLAAEACVGIREVGGNNRGPMVELIQETIGGHSREAWCMAFVQTCIAYAELKTGVQSPLFASEHCMTTWRETPKEQRVEHFPLRGAIAIWRHGSSDSGHTGIKLDGNAVKFDAVEGNTERGLKPDGSIERDGGGVYHTRRSMQGDGNMHLVGFLKPF